MTRKLSTILGMLLLLFGASTSRAQIADTDASAQWIASKIASDAGGTAVQYADYSRKLARTISLLSPTAQKRVLGYMPPSGLVNPVNPGDPGGPSYASPLEAISDPNLNSLDLLGYLLDQVPLSTEDLENAMTRTPHMEGDHLKDLLLVHTPLSNGVMVSSLENSSDNLTSEQLREIMIANSPVKPVVLAKVATTTKMNAADKAAVLAAQ